MSYLLDESLFEDTSYIVKHGGTTVSINIYDDDTIKDVLLKLAVASKQTITSDHIYAWIKQGSTIIPLSFYYPDINIDTPYKNKKKIDESFVNPEGDRLIVQLESTIHKTMDHFNTRMIHFITLEDYYKYLQLPKKVTDEVCMDKLGYTKDQWFNGVIKKYWPRLKDSNDFFEYYSTSSVATRASQMKIGKKIVDFTEKQLQIAYKEKNPIYPKDYRSYSLIFHNHQEDTTVHLFRLFNDISLGEDPFNLGNNTILSFTKITLENYTDTCCKLWKDSIYYTTDDEKRHVSKDLFLKWFRSPLISVPNTLPRFMDIRNSVTLKLYKDRITATIIIYSNGHIKLLVNELMKSTLSKEFIKEKIYLVNEFIKYLNDRKVYSEDILHKIQGLEDSFDICTLQLVYPIKNYKVDKMITLLKNLSTFVRFDKENQTAIYSIYKRVSDYESMESKLRVISLLHNSKRRLNRQQIIEELTKIFNISEEDAIDEYEQWEILSEGGKVFQRGENGIEFIIDLQGSNVKVDVSSINSYNTLLRFYHFMNFMMKQYNDYIEHNKDTHKLFGKESITLDSIQIEDDSDLNIILDQVPTDKETEDIDRDVIKEDSVLSTRASVDEEASSSLESEESLRLDNFSEIPSESRDKSESQPRSDSKSTSESDSDSGIGLLEDSESEGGGIRRGGGIRKRGGIRRGESRLKINEQRGGYNVHRYYLTRLMEFDKKSPHYINDKDAVNLFAKYSVKQRKSAKNKTGTQGYTYATKCTPNYHRQPIAITEEDKNKYEEKGIGVGVGYREAFNVPDRNPDTWYICPKYWNVKDEEPIPPDSQVYFKFKNGKQLYEGVKGGEVTLDDKEKPKNPLKPIFKDEYKGKLIEGSLGGTGMKDTDKYILARNHSYWDKMGQNVNNYRLELLENFHPNGYKVPCCFARKDEIKVGWDVEVRIPGKDKVRWSPGKVKSIKNISNDKIEYTITLTEDEIDTVTITNNLDIRRKRTSNYVSNNFPSNIGIYGYLNPILKNYLYPHDFPKIKDIPEINLYRKGIKRGTSKSDKTYLESIQELLHEENSSINELIGNIIKDLNNLKNEHNFISAIGGGSFINLFKKNIEDISDSDATFFRQYLKRRKNKFTGKPLERQIQNIKDKESLLKMLTVYCDDKDGISINRELTELTAIQQFTKYLLSDSEIIIDTYVSPVLTTIAKFPSKTFGSQTYQNLSIVVFEGNSEDVFIEPPIGGFDRGASSIMLLYKERGHLYEPIIFSKGGYKQSILSLDRSVTTINTVETYEKAWINNVIDKCKDKINELYIPLYDLFIDIDSLKKILTTLNYPIVSYIYDNYNKIVLVETKGYVYIPVRPFIMDTSQNNKYIGDIKKSKYKNCITILTNIDKEIIKLNEYNPYLKNAMITVSGIKIRGKGVHLKIKEIVFENGSYIPVKEEDYSKIHKLPVVGNISYSDVDKTIGLYGLPHDTRSLYNKKLDCKNLIRSLFFQKSYLMIKEKESLMNTILQIKNNEIMLHVHKRERIFNILVKSLRQHVILEGIYKEDIIIDKGSKMIIPTIDELTSEELYNKLLKLFVDLLLNYSEKDYGRFLQVDIDISKIKNNIKEGEYFLQQSDIDNEAYLEYFIRYSDYIRNVGIYNQGLSRSKQIQLNNMKQKNKLLLEKTKEYPEILYSLFGRSVKTMSRDDDSDSDIDVIVKLLVPLISEQQEINPMIVQHLLTIDDINNHRIDKDDLMILSKEYKIGFCLVTKEFTKKLYYDVNIAIDEHSFTGNLQDSSIILLYQDDKYLYPVIKNEKESIQIKDITSKRFEKEILQYMKDIL